MVNTRIASHETYVFHLFDYSTEPDHQVWDLWREGRALEVADPSLGESYQAYQVLRCIHIGLLCVQELANDRPSISEVASMLCHETTLLSPKQPAFIFKTANAGTDSSPACVGAVSVETEASLCPALKDY
ncbi:hypothetical protein RJ639_021058 [Escallonia herrerae]|uniref:Uncharacterized protein n=1 Tax=Escallonia herrerae TaxID=1293975 RepID=A0AA88V2J6_9ASTE|nr:hypothetical protein RJ639_021058 [Escallonia herrerae]